MIAKVNVEKCNGCGDCVENCPGEAIKIENDKAVISEDCIECGVCIDVCENNALSLQMKEVTKQIKEMCNENI